MANASYRAGDPGVNELYGKEAWRKAVNATYVCNPKYGLWGKPGSGKPFIYKDDFKTQSGRRVEIRLLNHLNGPGYTGGANLSGKEKSLTRDTFKLQVSTVKSPPLGLEDEESDQAIPEDVMASYRDATGEWYARVLEAGVHMQLAGATFTTALDYYKPNGELISAGLTAADVHPHTWTLNNATAVPTTGRLLLPDAVANAQSLGSTNTLDVDLINAMVDAAMTSNPPMLPCNIFGHKAYLVLVHVNAWSSFVASAGQYDAVNKALIQGGFDEGRDVYQGRNLTPWNNCFFLQSIWPPPAQNSSTAAAIANTRTVILCGQNALVMAHGKGHDKARVKFRTEGYNLGALRCCGAMLYGGSKVTWTDPDANTRDHAVIVGAVYAANTGDAS